MFVPMGMRTDQAVGAEVLRVLKPLGVHARLRRSKRWRSRRRLAADSWNWRAAGALRSLTCTPAIRCCGSDESSGRRRLERRWNEALQVERGVEGGAFDREPVGHGNIRRGAHDALECAARVKQAPRRRSLWTRIFLRLRPLNAQAARRSDIDNVVTSLSQSPRLEVRRSRRCCLRKCAPR